MYVILYNVISYHISGAGLEGSRCSMHVFSKCMLDTCMILGPTPYKGEGARAPLVPPAPTPIHICMYA